MTLIKPVNALFVDRRGRMFESRHSYIIENLEKIEQIEDIELKALKYFCYVARTQMFIDGNKRVAQLIANKVLIENDIGIFQIPIDKLEEFKGLLFEFYETAVDGKIIDFMKVFCIKRIAR